MLHRRRFLSAVALAPVVVSVAPIAGARADGPRVGGTASGAAAVRAGGAPAATSSSQAASSQPTSSQPGPREGEPVPTGQGAIGHDLELAGGFRVLRSFDVFYGALPFLVEGEGERFQVDVLRRAPSGPGGVFDTERLSLFVHGTSGAAQERGARVLGLALERRIEAGAAMPELASFTERRARHSAACFNVDFVPVHPRAV